MWRRTWSSPSTTRTNCTSAEQRTQTARRTPASSSEDFPAAGASGDRESLPDITPPEADTPCTTSRLTARGRPSGCPQCIGGGSRYRQQRRLPQEQAHGRLQLLRRLPARPLYGQVDQRDRRRRVVLGDRKRMRNVPESGWRTRQMPEQPPPDCSDNCWYMYCVIFQWPPCVPEQTAAGDALVASRR